MIREITQWDFVNAFSSSDNYKDSFSYEGLIELFEFFEQLDNDSETPINFDMVEIACTYAEYDNLAEFQDNYTDGKEMFPTVESIGYVSTVLEIPNTERFIIEQF